MLGKGLQCSLLGVPAIAIGCVLTGNQPAVAAAVTVACDVRAEVPVLTVTVSEGERSESLTMLSFLTEYFTAQEAAQTCQATAVEVQQLMEGERASYLASDNVDRLPTVCMVPRRGMSCNSSVARTLFSVDRVVAPSEVLYDMLGEDFKESEPDTRTVSRIYKDVSQGSLLSAFSNLFFR
ncbi:MAG: COP23 domain-containing protein [Cyanobacteria bacterium J06641_5]